MIKHPSFEKDPWRIRETELDLNVLSQTESVFALSNGHLGLRGNLDEGEPYGLPGTYLNSVYDLRPVSYVEPGYGYPESAQTVINVTNGKLIRLLVDDEPFDVRYGSLNKHVRTLDLRGGTLERVVEWTAPSGQMVRVTTRRMVSFTQRAVAAISYQVEPLNTPTRVVVQSELVANEPMPSPPMSSDPRAAVAIRSPLHSEINHCDGLRAGMVHRTTSSGLSVAASMDHVVIDAPPGVRTTSECSSDLGRVTMTAALEPGQSLRFIKLLAYGWSSHRSRQALNDQALAALTAANQSGWDGLLADQRAYLDEFWSNSDVELDGDPEVQLAVRFGLFNVLQAGARGDDRPIPAKGLTGPGYDGHAFWDTETFVLPMLTCTLPLAAASALRWRQSTLPAARARAHALGLEGAAFPWRTISGEESSTYWPASIAAMHINGDIADAVVRHMRMTDDEQFEANTGLELLVETARLWWKLGHFDGEGRFRIDGVTGPDEYTALSDNNVYTNLMAQQNLIEAAAAVQRHPDRAAALRVADAEIACWRRAADAILIPYDERLGVHPQADGFTDYEEWDFDATPAENYPLFLHYTYFDLYRKQVIKQPDLVLAMQQRPDAFTYEQKARNFDYYERRTVRDSSLADATEAVMAAEVGHLDLAYDYLVEAALLDLEDLEHNTRDGIHIAAVAGAWIALVVGFGGMRIMGTDLCFSPRLPVQLQRLSFKLLYRGCRVQVTVTQESATYAAVSGRGAVRLRHHGEAFTVGSDNVRVVKPIPPAPQRPRPVQPKGREPFRRS